MNWWWIIGPLMVVYVMGFVATLFFHMSLGGMVSPGLSLLRSFLWPLFWLTGRPRGHRLPMD